VSKHIEIPGHFETVDIEVPQPPRGKSKSADLTKRLRVKAFVPKMLPPGLDLPSLHYELHEPLIAAERAISQLEGSAHRLANPHVLIGPFSRREAILSSAIEDTFTTIDDLARVEANLEPKERRDDAIEVRNYVRALEHGIASELPISLRLIRQLHQVLMDNTRGRNRDTGNFRRIQNYIGRLGSEPRFVPPPVNYLQDLLRNLEQFIHHESRIPDLVRMALVHYQFETIHPFLDGNGRVGRLLITLQLCQHTVLSKPLVYVSGYFEQHRAEYYDRLLNVSQRGEWVQWIRFFLSAVASQARDAQRRTDDLLSLQQTLHEKTRFPRASGLLPKIVDGLFYKHWVTASDVAERCGVTDAAARGLINKLESLGIVTEVTGANYGRVWFAPDILEVVRRDYE
jgi:Fic family protein